MYRSARADKHQHLVAVLLDSDVFSCSRAATAHFACLLLQQFLYQAAMSYTAEDVTHRHKIPANYCAACEYPQT